MKAFKLCFFWVWWGHIDFTQVVRASVSGDEEREAFLYFSS